jgi:hypothetical protein
MTSILKVDTIQDTAGNNIINESGDTITIGASGDTITIPSGATTTLTDGVSGDFKMNSGFGSIATAYGCRAWVNFNGTGTVAIRESGNVTSITDNGTGDYTVNFTTAMPDVNYCPVSSAGSSTGLSGIFFTSGREHNTAPTTSAYRMGSLNNSGFTDLSHVYFAFLR